jgi:hypothetical protein
MVPNLSFLFITCIIRLVIQALESLWCKILLIYLNLFISKIENDTKHISIQAMRGFLAWPPFILANLNQRLSRACITNLIIQVKYDLWKKKTNAFYYKKKSLWSWIIYRMISSKSVKKCVEIYCKGF